MRQDQSAASWPEAANSALYTFEIPNGGDGRSNPESANNRCPVITSRMMFVRGDAKRWAERVRGPRERRSCNAPRGDRLLLDGPPLVLGRSGSAALQ